MRRSVYGEVLAFAVSVLALSWPTTRGQKTEPADPDVGPAIGTARYQTHGEMVAVLEGLQRQYPNLAAAGSIGRSVQNRSLAYLRVTANVTAPRPLGRPMFKYVANMHGNEAVGRQMLLALAGHLLHGYDTDPELRRLVDTTDIYLVPSMNPDGFTKARVSLETPRSRPTRRLCVKVMTEKCCDGEQRKETASVRITRRVAKTPTTSTSTATFPTA